MITGDKYRITVLTDRLLRLEYSEQGIFEDRKTFAVVNRDFEDVPVQVRDEEGRLIIETGELILSYDKSSFTSYGLGIELKNMGTKWNYGDSYGNFSNLGGTARTLDDVDGFVHLEKGIFGRDGYAVLDDSRTPVIEGKEFVNREGDQIDFYFFGYGKDYYGGLRDFCKLCGRMPMVPRYALGNWWSRYYRYTEEEYLNVVKNFKKEGIPISVAVIDMDWHVTDVDPKYGTGWTGYSWNKELFPDYKRFLHKLHENKLAVTLNLHPADGIRPFEDMYEDMAKEMGMDPKSCEPVEFDFGDSKFRDAYFKTVMNPYEEDGVDFWWIDWQQGTGKKGAVDPLLLLNHYHYEDQKKRNVRPMIFSRYAGVGSHRYPVGFSGDSHSTWKSLDFQPYFTSTASNIAYGMWSHDIGGHMLGDKNLDRLVRWIQFGVFSPVMRIHSSCSPFFNKEPWTLPQPHRAIVKNFMKLRHELLPYLYSENHKAFAESKPLLRPMYYDYAENPESYQVPNQYRFGDNLIVSAITVPDDEGLKMGYCRSLIPEGRWYDIFNGFAYEGEKVRKLYRELSQMPVLIPAGGIVPMAELEETSNGTDNPKALCILVGGGADGEYTLYEDDGITMNYEEGAYVETKLSVSVDKLSGKLTFTIAPSKGDISLIPSKRNYKLKIFGIKAKDAEFDGTASIVEVGEVDSAKGKTVEMFEVEPVENDYKKLVFELLERAWISTLQKDIIFDKLQRMNRDAFITWVRSADIAENLKDSIMEMC